MRLGLDFYQREDILQISRDLLGKMLVTRIDGVTTAGMIVETEAYSHRERGCHAYDGRRTNRTSVMFGDGGLAYVYLCYGMHNLFNIVTNREGVAEAVLVRALEPVEGRGQMERRRGSSVAFKNLTSGPGKLTKSMGIDRSFNGKKLVGNEIWLESGKLISTKEVAVSERIGIDYAGDDARLPWRFHLRNNPWVSAS